MKHRKTVDVLVVGAGPAGMAAALRLARAGLKVKIIDKAEGPTTWSYACGIHPGTLPALEELGLLTSISNAGNRIDVICLYDRGARRGELDFSKLAGGFPYALALPQSELEARLETELRRHGVNIDWNHRLARLDLAGEKPKSVVERFGLNSTGIIYAETTMLVQSEWDITADFVIGTDGSNSFVRKALDVELESPWENETFILCDFESDTELGCEARIQIEDCGMEMLWPLSRSKGHWIIQTPPSTTDKSSDKERIPFLHHESEEAKSRFASWAQSRAPWFVPQMKEIEWLAEVCVGTGIAATFGENRCWLAGDSAHQTNPVGMHSFNLGLLEAIDLAEGIEQVLKGTSRDLLESYSDRCRRRWDPILKPMADSNASDVWIRDHWQRIIPYLPASGPELTSLLEQVGIRLHEEHSFARASRISVHASAAP